MYIPLKENALYGAEDWDRINERADRLTRTAKETRDPEELKRVFGLIGLDGWGLYCREVLRNPACNIEVLEFALSECKRYGWDAREMERGIRKRIAEMRVT